MRNCGIVSNKWCSEEDRIEIGFGVDTNGLVQLAVMDTHSHKSLQAEVDASSALTHATRK